MNTRSRTEAKPTTQTDYPGHFKMFHGVDITAIRPSHLKMFVILERCCLFTSYCWHANATLAKKYGCTVRQVTNILREMQEAGYLWRLTVNPEGFRRRAGIFLHLRLDPNRPVEDRPPPPEAIQRLWAARNRTRSASSYQEEKFPPAQEEKFPPAQEEKFPPSNKSSLSLNKDELEEPGRSLGQRQRKDHLSAKPGSVVSAQPTSAAAPDPIPAKIPPDLVDPPALTPGQTGFLASLDAGHRTAFDALPAAKQAQILEPHRLGFDRVIASDAIRMLSPPPPPPSPVPKTTAELLERLPGAPAAWSGQAAEALAQDFGLKEDRKLWGQFRLIAEAIRLERIDPAHAINAYHQAMKPGIKKPGGKFWAAFQCLAEIDPDQLSELAAPP
jgi:hypothetical protein